MPDSVHFLLAGTPRTRCGEEPNRVINTTRDARYVTCEDCLLADGIRRLTEPQFLEPGEMKVIFEKIRYSDAFTSPWKHK